MLERDLVKLFVASLQRDFPHAVVMKNHGEQFQVKGRPDLEASVYGRHCLFELKSGTLPTPIQTSTIQRYSKAGSVAGLVVYHEKTDSIYFVHSNLCKDFTYRDVNKYLKIGGRNAEGTLICSTRFLWTWVSEAYLFYVSPQEVWDIYYGKVLS